MPTRDDVARLAGVSTATVSRVYNTPSSVDPGKVIAVRKAARRLGYVPDKNASALRRSGSGAIALVERRDPWLAGDRIYAWFYARIIRAVKAVIDASPYHLILLTAETPADLKALKERKLCDGFVSHELSDPSLLAAAQKTGLPHVSCWRNYEPGFNTVHVDERRNGKIVAERFLSAGLDAPAHITGRLKTLKVCRDRLEGFESAYPGAVKVLDHELGIRGGYLSAERLVPSIRAGRIDSVFVVNDETAVGAIQAFTAAGLRIPKDVSVIGNGNLPIIDFLPIRLTTVDECLDVVYGRATEMVLELIREDRRFNEFVSPKLIEGDSVLPARR